MVPLVQSEDLTSWTEVDPNNHIDYSADQVNFTYYCNEDARLYKDYGVGYFQNFTHLVDCRWVSQSGPLYQVAWIWGVANSLDDGYALRAASDFLAVIFAETGGSHRIQLEERDSGVGTFGNYIGVVLGTWYHLTISRYGTDNITCAIYSDYARTSLLASINVTSIISTNFRYAYAANTWNRPQTRYGLAEYRNLTFVGVAPGYITFYFITEGGQFWIDKTNIANATQNVYDNATILELAAIPKNRSWFFMNYTWISGSSDTNPYNFTVSGNNTIWLNLVDPIIAGKEVPSFLGYLILAPIFVVCIGGLIYWAARKK